MTRRSFANALMARTGKRAHLVAALVSRSYVDLNRSSDEAYETAAAGVENPSYNGGYIVGTYGLAGVGGANAVQLEFGMNYRQSAVVATSAAHVADALLEHLLAHAPGTI